MTGEAPKRQNSIPVPSHTGDKKRFHRAKNLTRKQNEKHFTFYEEEQHYRREKCEFRNITIRSTKGEISGP